MNIPSFHIGPWRMDWSSTNLLYRNLVSFASRNNLSTFSTLLTSDSALRPTLPASPQGGAIAPNSLRQPYWFQCIAVGCSCAGSTPHHPSLPDASSFEFVCAARGNNWSYHVEVNLHIRQMAPPVTVLLIQYNAKQYNKTVFIVVRAIILSVIWALCIICVKI